MRPQMIAEIGGSLVIVTLTGLFMIAGLVSGIYCLMNANHLLRLMGLILVLFGIENLPICALWCRQVADEYVAMMPAKFSGR